MLFTCPHCGVPIATKSKVKDELMSDSEMIFMTYRGNCFKCKRPFIWSIRFHRCGWEEPEEDKGQKSFYCDSSGKCKNCEFFGECPYEE